MAWLLSGHPQYPLDQGRRDLDLALSHAQRATELDPLDYHFTMLATVHALRGESAPACAAQRRAIEVLESKRPKIAAGELESFEAELAKMRETLAKYEARTK